MKTYTYPLWGTRLLWGTCLLCWDNIDFVEDTPDGEHTLHTTEMTIFQQFESNDVICTLEVRGEANNRPISDSTLAASFHMQSQLENYFALSFHSWRVQKPLGTPNFGTQHGLFNEPCYEVKEKQWFRTQLLVQLHKKTWSHMLMKNQTSLQMPPWAAHHSLINYQMNKTCTGCPPLIVSPAH